MTAVKTAVILSKELQFIVFIICNIFYINILLRFKGIEVS